MILQLTEMIPMKTPLGDGYAILVQAGEHDQYWTVALESGALVTFRQDQIKIASSYTHARGISDKKMKGIVSGK
jgi:hypothetical protein